ncbi:hypothetical protein NUW54_g14335 [Trametes sanguinea]|uniref:Uncharacterized protein n=1 Tax=Trametes sanguinea TaxID=158606 RepID=A0ACC1MDR6_9APHY|nr:hypothetical protein NUW54_g14335 [Trametes sanguinea]
MAPSHARRYRTSAPVRERRRKARPKKGGKAGNQGIFHGAREVFISQRYDDYLEAVSKNRAAQDKFWRDLFQDYWSTFPWRLPLDQEPDEEGDWDEPEELTEELEKEKQEIIQRTQKVRGQ